MRRVSEVRGMQGGMGGVLRACEYLHHEDVGGVRMDSHMAHGRGSSPSRLAAHAGSHRKGTPILSSASRSRCQLSAYGTGTIWYIVHLVVAHADEVSAGWCLGVGSARLVAQIALKMALARAIHRRDDGRMPLPRRRAASESVTDSSRILVLTSIRGTSTSRGASRSGPLSTRLRTTVQ